MLAYLDFPDKYKTCREYEKTRFVEHANLTPAEKKYILAYSQRIVVLYTIQFPDHSEIPVIFTEMGFVEGVPYYLQNYVKAIAAAIPYKLLILLKCRNKLKYFVYDAHENKANIYRMAVEQLYATPSYSVRGMKDDVFHKRFIKNLHDGIEKAESAEELYQCWMQAVADAAGGWFFAKEQVDDEMFAYEVRS